MEAKFRGEYPINLHITTFPEDARLVLRMREWRDSYLSDHQVDEGAPVSDLVAEQSLYDSHNGFRYLHDRVRQPLSFSLPTPVLRFLAWF